MNKKISILTLALLVTSMIIIPTVSACRNRTQTEYLEVPFTGSIEIWLEDPGKICKVRNLLIIKNAYWKGTSTTETGTLPYERWYTIVMNLKTGKGIWIARAITTIEAAPGIVIGTFEGGGFGKINDYVFSFGNFELTGTGVVEGLIIKGTMENEIVEGDWINVGSHALTITSGITYVPIV